MHLHSTAVGTPDSVPRSLALRLSMAGTMTAGEEGASAKLEDAIIRIWTVTRIPKQDSHGKWHLEEEVGKQYKGQAFNQWAENAKACAQWLKYL